MNWRTMELSGWLIAVALLAASCGGHGSMPGIPRPGAEEFGLGPRESQAGLYRASLEPTGSLEVGRMHSVRLHVRSAEGAAVETALIRIDGGMPQHGHGLPTRPRVTAAHGNGFFEVEGLRFNMGGWWVLSFSIVAGAGTDTVTFNLDL